ncbi:MAG: integron integrase [Fibrobacteres bacterium]|nr:integron integrase [Fibrobacterota bacterium]
MGIQGLKDYLAQNSIFSKEAYWAEKWVEEYLAFVRREGNSNPQEVTSLFLEDLRLKGKNSYCIKKAEEALKYYYQFKGCGNLEIEKKPENVVDKPQSSSCPLGWYDVEKIVGSSLDVRRYSERTKRNYLYWLKKFIEFVKPKLPLETESTDARKYIEMIAGEGGVSASTQNQAFNALLFVFRTGLKKPYAGMSGIRMAKRSITLPSALSKDSVKQLIDNLKTPYKLIGQLMYGCGLRLSEVLKIRLKDLNLQEELLTIRRGKGGKDRILPMPKVLNKSLEEHILKVREMHRNDVVKGFDGVFMPEGMEKNSGRMARDLPWYWLFPAKDITIVKDKNEKRRYHIHQSAMSREVKLTSEKIGLIQRVTTHTFRHSFATQMIKDNYDITQVQVLLGHSDVRTTMLYTHTMKLDPKPLKSPLDSL